MDIDKIVEVPSKQEWYIKYVKKAVSSLSSFNIYQGPIIMFTKTIKFCLFLIFSPFQVIVFLSLKMKRPEAMFLFT
jgi:hypothetical protein